MRLFTGLMIIIILGVLLAGCTQMQGNNPVQKKSESQGGQVVVPTSGSQGQYPVPPEDIAVSAQINDKDLTDKTINVFFSGGKGQKMVKNSWVVIERSDGQTEQVTLPPRVQSGVTLQGSSGEDVIRVYAEYFDGKTYQIAEKKVRMRQRA